MSTLFSLKREFRLAGAQSDLVTGTTGVEFHRSRGQDLWGRGGWSRVSVSLRNVATKLLFHVCGGAHGFYDIGELIRKHRPDVLLIESFLEDRDGIR